MLVKLRDHLEKLHHFLHIAKSGSFRKAADVLHVTQPTLSYSIKLLEEVTGQPLFHRSSTGVKLTPSGVVLYEFCERYFIELDDLERRIRAPEEPYAGLIRVGTYESLAVHFWPRFIRSFSSTYRNVGLQFLSGPSTELRERLLDFDIDLTVSVEVNDHPGILATELFRDHYGFYLAPGAVQLANPAGRIVHEHDLAEVSLPVIFVPFARSVENKSVLQYLKEAGLSGLNSRYELDSFEAVREFACTGLGIAVLPTRLAASHLADGSLVAAQVKGFAAGGFGAHRVQACIRAAEASRPLLQLLVGELQKDSGQSMSWSGCTTSMHAVGSEEGKQHRKGSPKQELLDRGHRS